MTSALLHYEGSFGIDADVMKKLDILPFESVEVYNITNGERIKTYAIELPAGSGRFESNGAAAHLIREGDRVIVAAYTWLTEQGLRNFKGPKIMVIEGTTNREKNFFQSPVAFSS